jgi:hypothetical protein
MVRLGYPASAFSPSVQLKSLNDRLTTLLAFIWNILARTYKSPIVTDPPSVN